MAVALWKLATPNSDRSAANHFEVGTSTVGIGIAQVCKAINTFIYAQVIAISKVLEIIAGFERMGLPNCARAINIIHIPILCPLKGVNM